MESVDSEAGDDFLADLQRLQSLRYAAGSRQALFVITERPVP